VIRVLLVDDQALFREALHTMLDLQADIEVVAEAKDGQDAIELATRAAPDVVLMDMQMPVLDGVAATRDIRANHPNMQVIVLTTFDDDEYVFEGLRSGAVGYLLKDVKSDRLAEAIRSAARGESFLEPSVAAKVVAEFARLADAPHVRERVNHSLPEPLSERELEILRLIATGASNKEIATSLFVAEGTVKNHVTNILGKLGVRDRTQAALKSKELGLV